jgi:hypothetical protein
MSRLNRRRYGNRRFRFEILEARALLSAAGLPAHPAAEVAPLARTHHETIKGSFSGTVSVAQGVASFKSSGTASVLGAATCDGSEFYTLEKHHSVKYTGGTATLTDSSGDTIDLSFTGTGHVKSTTDLTFSLKGSVSGGSGTYAGATGSFSGKGSFDIVTDTFSIHATVTLKHL